MIINPLTYLTIRLGNKTGRNTVRNKYMSKEKKQIV